MRDFLHSHGISARVKHLHNGSLSGCWRLYNPDQKWDEALRERLTALGFTGFCGNPLHRYEGNGGMFSVFVRGHDELVSGTHHPTFPDTVPRTEVRAPSAC